MRRAANPTRKISITIPSRIFDELERVLSYSQSRSAFISVAIQDKLTGETSPTILEMSTRQVMAALSARDDVDDATRKLLLHLLSQQS